MLIQFSSLSVSMLQRITKTVTCCPHILKNQMLFLYVVTSYICFLIVWDLSNLGTFEKCYVMQSHVLRYCFRCPALKNPKACFLCPCLLCFNASLINDPYHLPALFISLRYAISIPGSKLFLFCSGVM